MQKTSQNNRRDTSFTLNDPPDGESRLKSEYVLLERKYERLVQKEKRMQVWSPICFNFTSCQLFGYFVNDWMVEKAVRILKLYCNISKLLLMNFTALK